MTATEAEVLKQQADEAAGFAPPVEETPTVQKPRHVAKAALRDALDALAGRVGITPDQQVGFLKQALDATHVAQNAIHEAMELAAARDFNAHQEAKAVARANADVGLEDEGDEEGF